MIKAVLFITEAGHPYARYYGILFVKYLITCTKKQIYLKIFDKHNGPISILDSLAKLFSENKNKLTRKHCIYFKYIKETLDTMKISLEQSLFNWMKEVNNADTTGQLVLPNSKSTMYSLAIKLQTWKHQYISDSGNITRLISSKVFFTDEFSNITKITRLFFFEFDTVSRWM